MPVIERELAPFDVRPHWGKLFTIPAGVLRGRYERWEEFKSLVARHDRDGKFRNECLPRTCIRRRSAVLLPSVFLFTTLDTKRREADFVRDLLRSW